MRAAAALLALALAPGASLPAQGGWIPPQPPCELPPANSKINNAITALKSAVEKPESRDPQLAQAKRLLTDAIVQDKQSANPAAWYYLGRLAVTTGDVAGADSALARALALAPKCADDIASYRHDLWGELLNNGLAAWQDGKQDSGLALLRAAVGLEPANPKPLLAAAGLLASRGNDDSAFAYYRLAAKTAGTDTAFARDKRDALANAWHLVVRKVQGHPAAQRVLKLRAGLDSTQRGIASDSTVLARLLASSQSRRARGTRLAPADQQLFTRDSTARAQAVAQRRARLAAALAQIAADSSALVAAFAPAIDALADYVAAYPGEPEAAISLATLYAQSGRWALAAAVFDSLAAHAPDLEPDALFATGTRLVEQGMYRAGARADARARQEPVPAGRPVLARRRLLPAARFDLALARGAAPARARPAQSGVAQAGGRGMGFSPRARFDQSVRRPSRFRPGRRDLRAELRPRHGRRVARRGRAEPQVHALHPVPPDRRVPGRLRPGRRDGLPRRALARPPPEPRLRAAGERQANCRLALPGLISHIS